MRFKILYIILVLFIAVPTVYAQDSIAPKSSVRRINSAVKNLSNSLETQKSNKAIAVDYIELAKELVAQGDYEKAENYLKQAVTLYEKEKDTEKLANVYRELAKTQELRQNYKDAISNYREAARKTKNKEFRNINRNDAERLSNINDPKSQSAYIKSNISHFNTSNNKKEAANAYQQMAEVKLKMDDKEGAIEELENALENVKDEPEEVIKIQKEIAKTYVASEEFDKAIVINQNMVEEAQKTNDPSLEIKQQLNLSQTYLEANEKEKAVSALKEAYTLAIENNQTLQAKNILARLTETYRKEKKQQEAILLYEDFVNRLDSLIQADSTLIDQKFFQIHEERITRLERERALQEELITKTNRFNYILIFFIILILVFLVLIAKSLYSINKKNKRIALQSLRREMNPHFIFNSLNSVNHFIAQNNELEANKYLSSYSKLMRNVMENSNKDFIPLYNEIEQLKEYLQLEHMRFRDKFSYEISIDDSLDTDSLCVPNMLIQPQLENAIWHGLRYTPENGLLLLSIRKADQNLHVIIEDNGIGLRQSKELKTKHQKQHNSRGLTNTQERIRLLNELYNIHISLTIVEKTGEESGVKVILSFPLLNKSLLTDEYSIKNKKRNR